MPYNIETIKNPLGTLPLIANWLAMINAKDITTIGKNDAKIPNGDLSSVMAYFEVNPLLNTYATYTAVKIIETQNIGFTTGIKFFNKDVSISIFFSLEILITTIKVNKASHVIIRVSIFLSYLLGSSPKVTSNGYDI